MGKQNEFFRKLHPEQFSDSKVIRTATLDRDFFDFYLETLTSKSMEKEFETFCRRIVESEICPNLLPHTGPTGGGDSKVDSETYPISEWISANWYYGDGNKAATERWAFAFSAKKDWKAKAKSDVKKIAEVNDVEGRNYKRIFFISNQFISDKNRSTTEDALKKDYCMDIRILDRMWLLDKVFSSLQNKIIAVESFGLSSCFIDEIELGTNDYNRKKELESIEKKLLSNKIKRAEYTPLARQSIILARELEFPQDKMMGLLERYKKYAEEYGTDLDVAKALYDNAWTICWWYPDDKKYYDCYVEFEKIALSQNNVYLFSELITLWINLYSISMENEEIQISEHTKLLQEKYIYYTSDKSKPNTAIEAKAAFQLIRFFLGDKIDDIVDEIIKILNDSSGHIDLDLYPLSRVIQEIPIFEKAEKFDELFELLVSYMSRQEKDSTAAIMLAKRGHSLKEEKPYEALAFFSRALMGLYNEDNKFYLIKVIIEMGEIFEEVGLLWAARNFYYYDFCLCLNQYMKFGKAYPFLLVSAHAMKYIELRLGQIIYSIEFDLLEKISTQIYPRNIDEPESKIDNYDAVLAIQLFRTPFETLKLLEKLPALLENRDLVFSNIAIKFELGYYDETLLSQLREDTAAFDEFISKWITQPALEKLSNPPWFGVEYPYVMKTSVLGCNFELNIFQSDEHGEVEIGATLFALIESFFGTGIPIELISIANKIIINLIYDPNIGSLIIGEIDDERPNAINIKFRDCDQNEFVKEQESFSDFFINLLGMVTSIMFPFESALEKIKRMVVEDAALARSQTFANSVFFGMGTLGKDTFSYESILQGYDQLPLIRTKKSEITDAKDNPSLSNGSIEPEVIIYGKLPDGVDFHNIGHDKIKSSSIINVPLWDKCGWKGIMFLVIPNQNYPPLLAPIFTNPACSGIFEEWVKEIGSYDKDDIISISIVKGINKKHQFWYRVIVGTSKFPQNSGRDPILIHQAFRLHTMEAENEINLKRFEDALKKTNTYHFSPVLMSTPHAEPKMFKELTIRKNKTSIQIQNAWEIEKNDFFTLAGIMPTDDPVIPKGKESAPIIEAIKRKRDYIK